MKISRIICMFTVAAAAAAAAADIAAVAATAAPAPPPPPAGEVGAVPLDRTAVLNSARRIARWQLDQLAGVKFQPLLPTAAGADPVALDFFNAERAENPTSWHQATFWLGMSALADRSGDPWVREAILAQGRTLNWKLGDRPYNADDQLIGSTWLWAAAHGGGHQASAPLQARFDRILAAPPHVHLALVLGPEGQRNTPRAECLKRWCWADALFMAPATWLELTRATGDARYRNYALAEFRATSAFLYDPADRLYFRDSRFFTERDDQGRKIFWSRGNGWAIAGLVRMLNAMPRGDRERGPLVAHFRELAGRLAELQRPDGYWSSSLLDTDAVQPETSGTALITYAIAEGIRQGMLPRSEYERTVRQGWSALSRAIQPDGRLGWVQPAGDRPGEASAASSQVYATGAYLLAATAIADLLTKN